MPFRIGPWEVGLLLLLLLIIIIVVPIVGKRPLKGKSAFKSNEHGGITNTYNKESAMIVECPECGTKNSIIQPPRSGQKYHCGSCGTEITFLKIADTNDEAVASSTINEISDPTPENTSGQGKLATVPKEIVGWSWGAFILSWIWSIGNNVWMGLLSLVPYAGIIMIIVLGVKGNEWAWQHKRWDSVEHFKITQKKWRDWGIWLLIIGILIWLAILMADL